MSSKSKAGRIAVTNWRVIERFGIATLVEGEPKTGRAHQIRVHLSELGYPILADKVYGPKMKGNDTIKEASKLLDRQALHAAELGFEHPKTGEFVTYNAPVPGDMKKAINFIKHSGT